MSLYDQEHEPLDIAFITGRSLSQVYKFRPQKKTE